MYITIVSMFAIIDSLIFDSYWKVWNPLVSPSVLEERQKLFTFNKFTKLFCI